MSKSPAKLADRLETYIPHRAFVSLQTPQWQSGRENQRRYGVPTLTMVGLPDAAVQEARERVRSAVKNSSCVLLQRHVTVNLAPADLKKEGSVPIARRRSAGHGRGCKICLKG